MKKFKIITAVFLIFTAAFILFPKSSSAQNGYVDFNVFYNELSPYGQWVDYPGAGYVWIPDAGPDFVPYYSDGHWVLTNIGWTWYSDYDWGWAPFHYGRWNYDNYYGWFWVPGDEWAPAWVIWRKARGYYGWAPMGPGINYNVAYGRDYHMPYDRWIFVRDRDFCREDFHRYHIDRSQNYTIYHNSMTINNTYVDDSRHSTYYYGPRRDDVQYYSGHVVRVVNIRENERPTQNMDKYSMNIYRPRVNNSEKDKMVAPTRLTNIKEVKPIANRSNVNQNNSNGRRNDQPGNNRQGNETERRNPASNSGNDLNKRQNDQKIDERQNPPAKTGNNIIQGKQDLNQRKSNQPVEKKIDNRNPGLENNVDNKNVPGKSQIDSRPSDSRTNQRSGDQIKNKPQESPANQFNSGNPGQGRGNQSQSIQNSQNNNPPKQNPQPPTNAKQNENRGNNPANGQSGARNVQTQPKKANNEPAKRNEIKKADDSQNSTKSLDNKERK